MKDRLSVIVTASAIPSHPASHVIDCTIDSVRSRLPDVPIIVCYDGLPPDSPLNPILYDDHVNAMTAKAQEGAWGDAIVRDHGEWVHQTAMIRHAIDEVHTPCVMLLEHDTPLVKGIDFEAVCDTLEQNHLDVVRFSEGTSVYSGWLHMHPDHAQVTDHGPIQGIRTAQWSQRPHVSRTEWYRWMLDEHCADYHGFVEEKMHGVCSEAWRLHGEAGWARYRLALYAENGDPQDIGRHAHIDGRRTK
jgi:hypothetical protein